jgi:uncharacterized membrane protein YecN with MAPEG domain
MRNVDGLGLAHRDSQASPCAIQGISDGMSSVRISADRIVGPATVLRRPGMSWRVSWQIELLLLAVLACALRVVSWKMSEVSYDPDESVYVVIAQQWLAGHLPYTTVWDQHPVGLPALLAVGGWLFGDILLVGRIGGSIAVALTSWLVMRFVIQAGAQRWAGVLAALLYLLCMTRFEALPAQTEVFNNALVTGAVLLLFRARTREQAADLKSLGAAGLLLGIGLQVKYVVFPECVLLCVFYLALRARSAPAWVTARRAGVMMLAGLAPSLLAGGIYAWAGQWAAFWQANFSANVAYALEVPSFEDVASVTWWSLRPCGVILLTAGVTLALGLRRALLRRSRAAGPELWLACWLLAAVLDICLPLKFWTHYFLALLPPACIACGLAVSHLGRTADPRLRKLAVLLGLALLVQPTRIAMIQLMQVRESSQVDPIRLIAADIAAMGPGRLYVYNDVPLLYYLTARTPPLRYILPSELAEFASSSGAQPGQEVAAVLASRPRYIVTSDPPRFEFPAAIDAMTERALADYDIAASYPNPVTEGRLRLHVLR